MPGGERLLPSAVNPRVFPAGDTASINAARKWTGVDASPTGARNLLFEADLAETPTGVPWARSHGKRHWWSGAYYQLSEAARQFDSGLQPAIHLSLQMIETQLLLGWTTQVMGILNVTPDSFSDGGRWLNADAAVERGLQMLSEGAHILDIGGESTRPGAETIPEEEELRRVLPVLKRLRAEAPQAVLSIDTRKSSVARPCLEAGADWINDVSGLAFDPAMAATVATFPDAELVIMHSRADPQRERYSTEWSGEEAPGYEDVVSDVMRDLRRRCEFAMEQGVAEEQLWVDPGFGFGKTYEQNVEILKRFRELTSISVRVLVGTSRKSTVGKLVGGLPPEERLEATAATVAACVMRGAAAVRVHDVKEMARVVRVARQL